MGLTDARKCRRTLEFGSAPAQISIEAQSMACDPTSHFQFKLENMRLKKIWWIKPEIFIASTVMPLTLIVFASAAAVLENNTVNYDVPLFISTIHIVLTVIALLFLAIFSAVGRRLPTRNHARLVSENGLNFLFYCTCFGYIVWFGGLLANDFGTVIGAMTGAEGAVYAVRASATTLPGITTLTQFGVAYSCIVSAHFAAKTHTPLSLRNFAIIVLLALFRSIVYSERLALIEVVFPFMIALFVRAPDFRANYRRPLNLLRPVFPYALVSGGAILFTAFEYLRSWVNAYSQQYDSVLVFGLERFALYYVTAVNNIAGFMNERGWPTFDGMFTLGWLYKFPFIGSSIINAIGPDFSLWDGYLNASASLEFNNGSGILPVFQDWGIVLGGIFFISYGILAGRAFRLFKNDLGGLGYAYPMFLYSLIELLRIGYIYDARVVATLIGMFIAVNVFRKKSS